MTTTVVAATIGFTLLAAAAATAWGEPTTSPSTRPAAANGWNGKLFRYDRPAKVVVQESTPTAAQVDWRSRPPQAKADAPRPVARDAAPEPRVVAEMNVVHLRFTDADGDVVPALLCTPKGKTGPFPLVVAVHGLNSNKAQVMAQVAPALAKRGFAVLAPDMPHHGERPGDPRAILDHADPLKAFTMARRAINDVRQCIDLAEARPDVDTSGGITLVGYSMGSWINSVVGPLDDRVRAMVLMVGGAHEVPLPALLVPQIAACDPRLAIAHFAGRPLLMLSASRDTIVVPEMSRRLFAAAPEPKKQVWYDCGHLLTDQAYEDAAAWVAETASAGKGDAEGRRKAG